MINSECAPNAHSIAGQGCYTREYLSIKTRAKFHVCYARYRIDRVSRLNSNRVLIFSNTCYIEATRPSLTKGKI